jgi:hypothetical protein
MRRVYGPVYSYPLLSTLSKYIHELLNESNAKTTCLLQLAEAVMTGREEALDFTHVLILMASDVTSITKMARWTLALIELWTDLEDDIETAASALLLRSLEEVSDFERVYWIDRYLDSVSNLEFLRPILSDIILKRKAIQDVLLSRTSTHSLQSLLSESTTLNRRLLEARTRFFDSPNPASARILRICRKSHSETTTDMYQCALSFFSDLDDALEFNPVTGRYNVALMRTGRMENLSSVLAVMRLFNISCCFSLELEADQEKMILGFSPYNSRVFKRIEHNDTSAILRIEECFLVDHKMAFDQFKETTRLPIFFNQELERRLERASAAGQSVLGPHISWSDIN